jgi:hypothetical protein
MERPQLADARYGLQIWRVAANIFNKQSRTDDNGWSSSSGDGRGAKEILTVKNKFAMKYHKKTRTWTNSLDKRPMRKKMDMRFGTWNIRSMHSAGSLRVVVDEISKYKLDLVRV